ncbi:Kelch-like protein 10 [Aspergillus fumigatus]
MAAVISDNDNILDGTNGEEGPSKSEVVAETIRRNEMSSSVSALRANPKYSDFLILCGSHIFLAHKAIVCSQSDFFAKVFDSHFSVGYRVASSSSLTRKPSDRGIAGSLHGENQALRPSAGRPSAPRLPLFKRLHILSGLRFSYIILSRRTMSTGGSCWLVQDLMLQ